MVHAERRVEGFQSPRREQAIRGHRPEGVDAGLFQRRQFVLKDRDRRVVPATIDIRRVFRLVLSRETDGFINNKRA